MENMILGMIKFKFSSYIWWIILIYYELRPVKFTGLLNLQHIINIILKQSLILKTTFPTFIGYIGVILVIVGMILNSLFSE